MRKINVYYYCYIVCNDSPSYYELFNNYTTVLDNGAITAITGIPQTCSYGNNYRLCNKPSDQDPTLLGMYVCNSINYSCK